MNDKIKSIDDDVVVAPGAADAAEEEAPKTLSPIIDLANRSSRSTIAVIDTIVQRGGFRGEELSTIGQLRDQCVQIVALAETEMQNLAQE